MPQRKLRKYILNALSPEYLAKIDYYLRPRVRRILGRPFNGQSQRQRIFREILKVLSFRAVVETGIFRGSTTQFMAKVSHVPVYGVDINPRFFHYARLRFKNQKDIHVALGDSRAFLQKLFQDSTFPKDHLFFYLDAHWHKDFPLREEVQFISQHWRDSVIMIDDFEVPGDAGYSYDHYGPDKKICLEYLSPLSDFGYTAFFPALSSELESGWKTGCVVLGGPAVHHQLMKVASLRRYQPEPDAEPVNQSSGSMLQD